MADTALKGKITNPTAAPPMLTPERLSLTLKANSSSTTVFFSAYCSLSGAYPAQFHFLTTFPTESECRGTCSASSRPAGSSSGCSIRRRGIFPRHEGRILRKGRLTLNTKCFQLISKYCTRFELGLDVQHCPDPWISRSSKVQSVHTLDRRGHGGLRIKRCRQAM